MFYNENGLPDSSIASNSYQHNIKYTYSWDEHKRELKISFINDGKKLNEQEAYSFNKNGLLNSYLSHTIIDRRQTYIYRKFDKNGNWTQRFTTSYQDVYIGAKVTHQITERSIIYYP